MHYVRFQVLTASSTWDAAPCNLVDTHGGFSKYRPDEGGIMRP